MVNLSQEKVLLSMDAAGSLAGPHSDTRACVHMCDPLGKEHQCFQQDKGLCVRQDHTASLL